MDPERHAQRSARRHQAIDSVVAYLRAEWPGELGEIGPFDLLDVTIPRGATDAQIDEILKRGNLVLAQVFEVGEGGGEPSEEEVDEEDEMEGELDDELYYGPSR